MSSLWQTVSENVVFVLEFLALIVVMFLIAYVIEKAVKKKNNDTERVLATRKIVVIGVFSAIAAILMVLEFPVPFAPSFYGLDFSKTKGHMVRACMEGVALSLKHNLEVAKEAGADVEVLRAMGGSANSLLWTQIKSDITGKPIVVPSSDTATTLGAAILAGVGVGMYQDYDEAIRLTVKETRRHEPNPENRDVYEKTYKTYLNLYKSLEPMMRNEEEK